MGEGWLRADAVMSTLKPDASQIRAHIEILFHRVKKEYPGGQLELARNVPDSGKWPFHRFPCTEAGFDAAVEWAEDFNKDGSNLYVGINPRPGNLPKDKPTTSEDIKIAFVNVGDLDTQESIDIAKNGVPMDPTMFVRTGTVPNTRVQPYWEREDGCRNMKAWTDTQIGIANYFQGDRVTDPRRVMRLAGTVSYPSPKKAAKGYIVEPTVLKTEFDGERRDPVNGVKLHAAFARFTTAEKPAPNGSGLNLPGVRNSDALIQKNLAGDEWHNNIVSLVAQKVSQGWTDTEIKLLCRPMTLPEYTIEDTDREVKKAIQGARDKGYDAGSTLADITPTIDGNLIQSSEEFVAEFTAPDYLVDGIVQRRYLYSLTARTGDGKTAVLLTLAACVAQGEAFGDNEVALGRVCYFAGENPDDVRARWLLMGEVMGFDANSIDVHFIPGTFSIPKMYDKIAEESEEVGGFDIVIVDTSAAYFQGDEENSNTQLGQHARELRCLTTLPGGPCVIVACHPVKNPSKGNLLPRGGGAFVAEVDGNMNLWSEDKVTTELSKTEKHRGPPFEPVTFRLDVKAVNAVKDSKGRLIPSVIAVPISDDMAQADLAKTIRDEDAVLVAITSVRLKIE